jgi:isovaleryl-CoA dehydrogenase
MMRNLEIEQVALAAMAVGIARRSVDEMIDYSSNRPAVGKPNLFSFGQIQKHIAESHADYMAWKCYLYGVANGVDLSTYGNGLDADGVKLYSKKLADRAFQDMGGYGYVGEYNVERLWVSNVLF